MGVQQPEPAPPDWVSAKSSTQAQPPASLGAPSRPCFLSPPCPLLPGCYPVQPSSPCPASSWAEYVHSLHISQCPPRQASFFLLHYGLALGLRPFLPPFSSTSQPFPNLKLFCCGFPHPNLRIQVLSPWPLLASALGYFLAATCPFHLSALLSWLFLLLLLLLPTPTRYVASLFPLTVPAL